MIEIERLNADVVVLPEAYLNAPAEGVDERLRVMGYSWYDTKYHDTLHDEDIKRWGYPFMRVLYRLPLVHVETRRWGDVRNLPLVMVRDLETQKVVTIIAAHLDDLTEERRLVQTSAIAEYLKTVRTPVIMAGDFNAMWHRGWQQYLAMNSAKSLFRAIPLNKLSDVLTRLSRMATGRVMTLLKEAGLHEADPSYRPTTTPKMRSMPWMPSIRLAQIDHILFSPGVAVSTPVIGADKGSDHRSLLAKVTIK